MKPKLLITLGCSWTSGIGTSDPYHHMWPRQLGIKLGFDKLINLGIAGGSNSGAIKRFNEMVNNFPINDYDILVIFLMTEPSRFSFFIDEEVTEYRPNIPYPLNPIVSNTSFGKAYLEDVESLQDFILEQKFYVNVLESMCKTNNMDLILTSWSNAYPDFYQIHKNKDIHLFKVPRILKLHNKDLMSDCGHPNDKGQVWVMNVIIKGIKQNHSKWYSETPNENLDWEVKNKIEHWHPKTFL